MHNGSAVNGRTVRHIAYVNILGPGHVYPALPVARELVRRGHRVSFATVAERRAAVVATGAELVPYTSVIADDTDPSLVLPARPDFLPTALLNWLDEVEHVLPQLTAAYTADRPDLIVYDASAYAGKILAAQLDVPAVQAYPFLPASDKWSVAQNFNAFDPTHPAFLKYARRLGRFLKAQGLDWVGLRHPIERSTVVYVPRSFQPAADAYPENYHFVGPCLEPRAGYAEWNPPADDDRPILFATLGTVYNANPQFFRACVEAFADDWQVVLGVGPRLDPAELGPLPPTVQARATLPQLAVLGRSRVFVSHAGMGGLMEALSLRVPLVCVPQTPEQEANAYRVEELGLGVRLSSDGLTATVLREAVRQVTTDPGYAERIAAMADDIAAAGGAARAADVIEAALPATATALESQPS